MRLINAAWTLRERRIEMKKYICCSTACITLASNKKKASTQPLETGGRAGLLKKKAVGP